MGITVFLFFLYFTQNNKFTIIKLSQELKKYYFSVYNVGCFSIATVQYKKCCAYNKLTQIWRKYVVS